MLHQFFDRVCTCTPRHASRTSRATFNIQLFILCDGRMVCFYVLKKFFCFLFVFFFFVLFFAIKMDGQWRAKFVPGNNSDQSRVFQGLQKFFSIKMYEANSCILTADFCTCFFVRVSTFCVMLHM